MRARPIIMLGRGTVAMAGLVLASGFWLGACAGESRSRHDDAVPYQALAPFMGDDVPAGGAAAQPRPAPDLTKPGAVARGTTPAWTIDTRQFPVQIQPIDTIEAERRVREIVPSHERPAEPPPGPANTLVAGETLDEERATITGLWPSVGSTGWTPPDPCLAVGPNHVVVTVNQSIAWYTRSGTQQFSAILGSQGSPGFFEGIGASTFAFDPKCVYDHLAQRFIVLALEVYQSSNEAYITLGISDDADPNGTWHMYRTDCVMTVGANQYWWDFPGLGYDQNAIYVTGNLFQINGSGYAGGGFRVYDKAPLLSGQPAVYSTLRASGEYTVQPAIHFGSTSTPYFATIANSTTVRLWSINNPLTTPSLTSINVAIPSASGAISAPTLNGSAVSSAGKTMPYWRNGRLWVCHNASTSGRNLARWHEIATNSWPASGSPTRLQSGTIDAGPNLHTIFPAIAVNTNGEVGVALGTTGEFSRVNVAATGRRATDPAGRIGVPSVVKPGERDAGGRWGDYYAICIDPTDDTTFWGIGEYARSGSGWQNWVYSFRVSDNPLCHAVPDDAGIHQSATPIDLDVLANDWHSHGLSMVIDSFQSVSNRGGLVQRVVGAGPGGRDLLRYTPPVVDGIDSFTYTLRDTNNSTGVGAVSARLFNPANYRTPEDPTIVNPGVNVAWYALSAPTALPDFTALSPYATGTLTNINIPSTGGVFSSSGRSDDLGAVFTGYVDAPTTDLYTFSLESDDGSRMFLGATRIIDHDGAHSMSEKTSALIGLKAGRHLVRVEYFEGTGSAGLIARWTNTTTARQVIPASRWWASRPCTADFNNSGGVPDDADVAAFFASWNAGDWRADINQSGGTPDDADVALFFEHWNNGC
ncbi:MAG: hypothetical protein IPM33_06340 [Phycisphaerales bacterium]|nr:hypothetical protein [Phycisphaerales bacterium]